MDSRGGIGVLVIALGVTQMVGSITGQEAPMLAALFDPSLLRNKSGNKPVPLRITNNPATNYFSTFWNSIGKYIIP